ncbi:MAG TPA: hypothetical protein DCW66_01425, partial [Sphingobacterium sp.]|nr:hypothetical protein [Sphingobacterium sp.]
SRSTFYINHFATPAPAYFPYYLCFTAYEKVEADAQAGRCIQLYGQVWRPVFETTKNSKTAIGNNKYYHLNN